MLFELLTGRQPHTGESPLAVAYKHVNEIVPAPSSLLPGLLAALDALVAMATSRDPELRPMHAGQFLRAINEVRDGLSENSHPYPRRPDSGQFSVPYGRDSLDYEGPGYGQGSYPGAREAGAVGASALPSLSPQSGAHDSRHPSEPLGGVNHTLVVQPGGEYDEYLQGSVSHYGHGDRQPAETGYRGHRASSRRAPAGDRSPGCSSGCSDAAWSFCSAASRSSPPLAGLPGGSAPVSTRTCRSPTACRSARPGSPCETSA